MPRRSLSRSADARGFPLRTEPADAWFASWAAQLLGELRRASHPVDALAGMVPGKQKTAGIGLPTVFTTSNPGGGPRGCRT